MCPDGFIGDPLSVCKADPCHKCDENASCTTQYGVQSCYCDDGYQGNGKKCVDFYAQFQRVLQNISVFYYLFKIFENRYYFYIRFFEVMV